MNLHTANFFMGDFMMCFIQWCNENNGFLSAILSLVGLMLSVIAIVVSIRTAKMPYKKKLLLGSFLSIGTSLILGGHTKTEIVGMSASATNIGNRTVNITYLGYAIKKNGRYNMIYPVNRNFDCKTLLEPSDMSETQFYVEELLKCFSRENRKTKLFVYAKDTEGTEYKRKAGNVGKLIDNLKE